MGAKTTEKDYAAQRHHMVKTQLLGRGISDRRLLSAMEHIPRHLFVPTSQTTRAYDDGPLPIGSAQTISQPYMVARMSELLGLDRSAKVLEIGTGSGYQTAVLAELAGHVYTIERLPELAKQARTLLTDLGYTNVKFIVGDGSIGYPRAASYDAILVTAAAPCVPEPLKTQLTPGGRMVLPITAGPSQELTLIERLADSPGDDFAHTTRSDRDGAMRSHRQEFRETRILACIFVPLIGEKGYPS